MKKCCISCVCLFFCCKCPNNKSHNSLFDAFISNDNLEMNSKRNQSLKCYGNIAKCQNLTKLNLISHSKVKKISCGDNHCLILFNDNKLASFGSNSNGQLGIEISSNTQYFSSLIVNNLNIPPLNKYEIWDIATGNNFSLILIGLNLRTIIIRFGLLKESTSETIHDNSVVNILESSIDTIPNVSSIYAFDNKVILLTGSNKIFIGENDFYGNKLNGFQLMKHFTKVDIQCVALGKFHCLLLDSEGNLYGVGKGEYGELGSNILMNYGEFRIILKNYFKSKIKAIAAGEKHSLILLTNGELYALGDNSLCQCSGYNICNRMPYKIHTCFKENIIDIYAGFNHNLCTLSNGEIYTWGDASYGKLGYITEDIIKQNDPKNLIDLNGQSITCVGIGRNMTVISIYDHGIINVEDS